TSLKTRVLTIDQWEEIVPTPADWISCAPFISQIATLPLVSCQRTSPLPSPLKSPVPTTDHAVETVPTPADCVTCAPLKNHIATLPPVSCQSQSYLPSPLKSR